MWLQRLFSKRCECYVNFLDGPTNFNGKPSREKYKTDILYNVHISDVFITPESVDNRKRLTLQIISPFDLYEYRSPRRRNDCSLQYDVGLRGTLRDARYSIHHGLNNYKDTNPQMPSLLMLNRVYRQSVILVFPTGLDPSTLLSG